MAQKTPRGAALAFYRNVVQSHEQRAECILWPFARNERGYAVFGKRRGLLNTCLVSRLVCMEVNGPPPSSKSEAAHTCGDGHGGCINPRHLEWKTSKQNKDDQIIHGTRNKGERNGHARLTVSQVRQIRSLVKAHPQRAVADMFGVDQSHVSNIVRGKQWRHVR